MKYKINNLISFLTNNKINIFLILSIVIIFVAIRLIPHIPNFTPILSIGLFLGTFYKNKINSILLLLSFMLISDLFLGFYPSVIFVYAGIIGSILIGNTNKNQNILNSGMNVFFASSLFFIISNFGVWLVEGFYTLNSEGLSLCYTLAIPFFKNELMGNIFYSGILFGGKYLFDNYFETNKALSK